MGKYHSRAPKDYLSIYLDKAPVIFGQMELWLLNALKEKIIIKIWPKTGNLPKLRIFCYKMRSVIVYQNHYINKILDVHPLWFSVFSQFKFFGFVTIWVFKFFHNFGFVTIWVFELSHLQFFSLPKVWVFQLSHLDFLSCQNFNIWVVPITVF